MDSSQKKIEKKNAFVRKISGIVVSTKMEKTIVVKVNIVKIHSKYKKRFTRSKKYKVHDEKEQCKVGDKVNFAECRPISKYKKWRVLY